MRLPWLVVWTVAGVGCAGGSPPEPAKPSVPVATAPEATSPSVVGLPLRGLRASEGDATPLLDGDPATTWQVPGDARGVRIELRPEQPVSADSVSLRGCVEGPGAPATWGIRVNGSEVGTLAVGLGGEARRSFVPPGAPGAGPVAVASLVLEVLAGQEGVCLGEIAVRSGDAVVPLAPPRSVKGRVRPSSIRTPAMAFHPYYFFDGRTDFAWQDGKVGGGGAGESVTITLDEPLPIRAIEVWNGDQSSPEAYEDAARARRFGVSVEKGGVLTLPAEDHPGPQTLPLPRSMVGRSIALSVLEVYSGHPVAPLPGSIRPPTAAPLALSELRLWDQLGPVRVETPERADRAAALGAQLATPGAGAALGETLDRRLVSVCDDGAPRTWTLRRSLDFQVAWQRPTGRTVWEGDWAPQEIGKPWTKLHLAGREVDLAAPLAPPPAAPWGTWVEGSRRVDELQVGRVASLDADAWSAAMEPLAKTPDAGHFACVADLDPGDLAADLAKLAARGAILVRGQGYADLFAAP